MVPAGALAERARDAAARLAAIPREVFALTKRRLREEAVERMDRGAAHDEQALALWSAPETHAHIRDYLAKTVRR